MAEILRLPQTERAAVTVHEIPVCTIRLVGVLNDGPLHVAFSIFATPCLFCFPQATLR